MVSFLPEERGSPLSFSQATFTALNIESYEDSEEEVDDTREIQVVSTPPTMKAPILTSLDRGSSETLSKCIEAAFSRTIILSRRRRGIQGFVCFGNLYLP